MLYISMYAWLHVAVFHVFYVPLIGSSSNMCICVCCVHACVMRTRRLLLQCTKAIFLAHGIWTEGQHGSTISMPYSVHVYVRTVAFGISRGFLAQGRERQANSERKTHGISTLASWLVIEFVCHCGSMQLSFCLSVCPCHGGGRIVLFVLPVETLRGIGA